MDSTDLEPKEAIALKVAQADMHYVSSSLLHLPYSAAAAEIALLQFGVLTSYEAQRHFQSVLGSELSTGWDPATAKAARMSIKFFADKERNLDGVVSHFEKLLSANHGVFFPPARRARLLDCLRTDLSVFTLDGRPYTSLIGAHYLVGLGPNQVADLQSIGSSLYRLGKGTGEIAGVLLRDSGIVQHGHGVVPAFQSFDAKSKKALPRLFGEQLEPALAAALMTVQNIASCAERSASREQCEWCEVAGRKHRFIALYQSLLAIKILCDEGALPDHATEMLKFLEEPESAWVLDQRALRNFLVHLGLGKPVAEKLGNKATINDVVHLYTQCNPEEFAARISNHLTRFIDVITAWMLSPTTDGKLFLNALHPAPSSR